MHVQQRDRRLSGQTARGIDLERQTWLVADVQVQTRHVEQIDVLQDNARRYGERRRRRGRRTRPRVVRRTDDRPLGATRNIAAQARFRVVVIALDVLGHGLIRRARQLVVAHTTSDVIWRDGNRIWPGQRHVLLNRLQVSLLGRLGVTHVRIVALDLA